MKKIQEYEVGINPNNKMYFIDSNVLLAISQYYYKGRCDRGNQVTEELKAFLSRARQYGIQNQFALKEVCFDYARNKINTDQMNKIMIAYDNLIMNMSETELLTHKGAPAPEANRNMPREYSYKGIFDCRLPEFFFGDNDGMKALFFEMYLYFLKIYSLYFERTSPMKKVEKLFGFMTKDVDIFLGYEFYLAVLLFIGQQDENKVASGIFKPMKNPPLHHVCNAVIDLFQYRMACYLAEASVQMKSPMNSVFVTMDNDLMNYIEHNESYNVIMTNNMITPIGNFRVAIKAKHEEAWNDFYQNIYCPTIKSRNMKLHTIDIMNKQRNKILNSVCQFITQYEAELY